MSLTLIPNTFATYALSDEEVAAGSVLSELQIAVLQNDLAEAAQQKVQLKVDSNNVTEFIQKEAELAGRILLLSYIIARSRAVVQSHLDAASAE
jgi:hypothetical protein